ncbi:MAG TPA: flagellar biosynthetic protein FliO [Aliidongia sp.]|uniref:flagellar biosynthetic protein FliO n=1 Tax=Aliidongia sp. TaxID=1914230 RepID=UPI002DDDB1D7|nr:flagellar biosynthetic protein FliO [Aliidongia sp.]HEV2674089.1 flagellar biosynthetic protein FliO [Aliidongia sp.]
MTDIARLVGALVFVLALIGLFAWLVRRFGPAMRLGRAGRLGMVESIAIDSRRRLLLVRRDQTEHLLLIGGTRDLVIETGITIAAETTQRGRAEPSFVAHLPREDA